MQVARALGVELELPEDDREPLLDDEIEPLFAALACRAPDAAMRGAGSLLALGDPRAIGAILQLTRETDAGTAPARDRAPRGRARAVAHRRAPRRAPRVAARRSRRRGPRVRVRRAREDRGTRGVPASSRTPSSRCGLQPRGSASARAADLVRVGAPARRQHARADPLVGDALDDEGARVRNEALRTVWAWHGDDPEVPLDRGAPAGTATVRSAGRRRAPAPARREADDARDGRAAARARAGSGRVRRARRADRADAAARGARRRRGRGHRDAVAGAGGARRRSRRGQTQAGRRRAPDPRQADPRGSSGRPPRRDRGARRARPGRRLRLRVRVLVAVLGAARARRRAVRRAATHARSRRCRSCSPCRARSSIGRATSSASARRARSRTSATTRARHPARARRRRRRDRPRDGRAASRSPRARR